LKDIQFDEFDNPNVWSVLLRFRNNDSEINGKIKVSLLSSRKLWDFGIKKDNLATSDTRGFIPIQRLSSKDRGKGRLEWADEELKILASRLLEAFGKKEGRLKKKTNNNNSFLNYDSLWRKCTGSLRLILQKRPLQYP
jgi:hypothetical protein